MKREETRKFIIATGVAFFLFAFIFLSYRISKPTFHVLVESAAGRSISMWITHTPLDA